jgi:hypothetical protein
MLTRKCGMTKPMPNGERESKPLANTQVTIKPEQGWSERTLISVISAEKEQDSMTLGKQTTSILVTLTAH